MLRGLPVPTLGSPGCRVRGPRPGEARGSGSAAGRGPRAPGQGRVGRKVTSPKSRPRSEMGEPDEPVVGERWRRGCVVWGKVILNSCKPGLREVLAAPTPKSAYKSLPGASGSLNTGRGGRAVTFVF